MKRSTKFQDVIRVDLYWILLENILYHSLLYMRNGHRWVLFENVGNKNDFPIKRRKKCRKVKR